MTDTGRPRGEELLSLASHQLKTPLAVIAGHAELLYARAPTDAIREEARYITDAAAQLSRTLDALLAVFAVDSVRITTARREIALGDLVNRALTIEAGLRGKLPRLPERGLERVVSADPTRASQALAVLLGAAYSEVPAGTELTIEVEERPGVAMLSIGCGGTRPVGDASRLALFIAARLVEADGGSLFVREQGGEVAHVVVMLLTPGEPGQALHSRVLIVDDDETMRRLLRATLPEEEGFVIVEASDGHKALEMLEDEPVDLVLLDWMMPGRSGADVLEQLRSRHPEVPVIVVTAELEPRQRELAESLGADIFLTKPFSPIQLLEHVERLLPGRAPDPARRDY